MPHSPSLHGIAAFFVPCAHYSTNRRSCIKKTEQPAAHKANALTAFAVAACMLAACAFFFAGCKNDDDSGGSPTVTEATEEEIQTENSALSIFRTLCDLAVDGVEELPETWRTASFECDEGFVLDKAQDTVRSLAVYSADDAAEYVSALLGESVATEDASWAIDGIGPLSFKPADGGDVYATLDVNIPQITNLSQIRFVPAEIIQAQAAENSFDGEPYYHAGDIIQRKKDNTYWMCVRPAGGPLRKDKSYWICLHPFDKKGATIIKSEKKSVTAYYTDYDDKEVTVTNQWVYAKNLMSIKTAKAAYHTLSILNMVQSDTGRPRATLAAVNKALCPSAVGDKLKEKGFDFYGLKSQAVDTDDGDYYTKNYSPSLFCIAYGSAKTDSDRKLSCRTSRTGKNANYAVVQPLIKGEMLTAGSDGKIKEAIRTHWEYGDLLSDYSSRSPYYSVTDTFDDIFQNSTLKDSARSSLYRYTYYKDKWYYDFANFLHSRWDSRGALTYENGDKEYAQWLPGDYRWSYRVIFSQELYLKDNKGNAVRPVTDSSYIDVFVARNEIADQAEWFDWWKSLDYTTRTVDGTKVDWNSENK